MNIIINIKDILQKMSEIYKNLDLNNLPNEEWLLIKDYENYQVSSLGRIKSLKYGKEKIRKQRKINNGYLTINLWKEGIMKSCLVHRLVANAFIPNPSNLKCVNHKDENKENNCVDNLEWCSVAYNNTYGSRLKKVSEKQINDPSKSKQVYQYSLDGELVAIWNSTQECKRNGYHRGNVSNCCLGKLKTHRGFKWSYTPINPK